MCTQARISKDSMSNTGGLVRPASGLRAAVCVAGVSSSLADSQTRGLSGLPLLAPCSRSTAQHRTSQDLGAAVALRSEEHKSMTGAPVLQVRSRQLWGNEVYTQDSDLVAVLMHQGFFNQHVYQARLRLQALQPWTGWPWSAGWRSCALAVAV